MVIALNTMKVSAEAFVPDRLNLTSMASERRRMKANVR